MKSVYIKRMAAIAAVLLFAAMTACSSCRTDTQPSEAQTETELSVANATAEDSQEATYNDYGEWDIP